MKKVVVLVPLVVVWCVGCSSAMLSDFFGWISDFFGWISDFFGWLDETFQKWFEEMYEA